MRRETGADPRTLELTFRERAAPAGSPNSYALLFADADLRPALAALYAFEAELRAAVQPRTEHAAAHLKLAWWAEEIGRIVRGSPLHPIGRALCAAAEPSRIDLAMLGDTLAAAQHDLARRPIADLDELGAYCQRSGGITQQLAALFGEPAADRRGDAGKFGGALGRGLCLAELLRHHVADLNAGRNRLPQSLLRERKVAVGDFLSATRPAGATALLDELAAQATEWLEQARRARDIDRARQRAGLVLAELAHGALQRMRGDHFSARSLGAPPAFTLLWRAWRTARST